MYSGGTHKVLQGGRMKYMVIATIMVPVMGFAQSKEEITDIILDVASEYPIDPHLVLAIAKVESKLNPHARGQLGEIGLIQLRPEYHKVIPGNMRHNLHVGIKYLVKLHDICSHYPELTWINCYNRGPYAKRLKHPFEFDYYKKVMREYHKINERMVVGL